VVVVDGPFDLPDDFSVVVVVLVVVVGVIVGRRRRLQRRVGRRVGWRQQRVAEETHQHLLGGRLVDVQHVADGRD
jgi:uncharacterized membrane protein YqgA involved in biofilm formation